MHACGPEEWGWLGCPKSASIGLLANNNFITVNESPLMDTAHRIPYLFEFTGLIAPVRGGSKNVWMHLIFLPRVALGSNQWQTEIFIRERPLQRIQQTRGCADISQHLLSFSLFCTEISHRVEWVYKPFLDFLWCFWCNNLLGTRGRAEQRSQREGYLFPFQSEGAFSRTSKRIEAKVLQLLMRVLKNKSVIRPNLTFIMEFWSYPKVKGRFCAHI